MQRVELPSSGALPVETSDCRGQKTDTISIPAQSPDRYDGRRSAGKQTNSNFVGTAIVLGTVVLGAAGMVIFRRKIFTPSILKTLDANPFFMNYTSVKDAAGNVIKGQYRFKIDTSRSLDDVPRYVEGTIKYLGNKVEVVMGGKTRQYGAWRTPQYLMESLRKGTLGQGPCFPSLPMV